MSSNDTDADAAAPYQEDDRVQRIREFVYGYYRTPAETPHSAWRSSTVDARYTHVEGDAVPDDAEPWPLTPAVGHRQIHLNVVYQRFAECRFHVRSVDVQREPDGGGPYLVLVVGYVTRGRGPPVAFVQSFVVVVIREIDQHAISDPVLRVYADAWSAAFGVSEGFANKPSYISLDVRAALPIIRLARPGARSKRRVSHATEVNAPVPLVWATSPPSAFLPRRPEHLLLLAA